jgi:hypothetical protein
MRNATCLSASVLCACLAGCTSAFPAGVDYESTDTSTTTQTGGNAVVFTSVTAGYHGACALKTDSTIACWGTWKQPGGTFKAVSVGGSWPCGLTLDGTVTCWTNSGRIPGANDVLPDGGTGSLFEYPTGTFASLSVGYARGCGLRDDGSVACWGAGAGLGNARTPPSGAFVSITVESDACGVRPDGTVECWNPYNGPSDAPIAPPPAGTFTSVSAGVSFSCGVRTDSTLACRGNDSEGETKPPSGTFASVSSGNGYACGVRTSGTLACWGSNSFGRATPPSGTFISIDAGYEFACGVRTNGTLACWGDNSEGESSPPAP